MAAQVPDSSVRSSLNRIGSAISTDPGVRNVYVGGSCAQGTDDAVSDIDFWVQSDEWSPKHVGGLLLAGRISKLAGMDFFHGVDREGTVVDILVGGTPWDSYTPLGTKPAMINPEGQLIEADLFSDFWINSYKHRKPLYRNLESMVCFGLHHDRMFLLRAWVFSDTGIDPGDQVFTIHGMTPLLRNHVQGQTKREELLGLPAQNRLQMIHAIDQYRSEILSLMDSPNALTQLVTSDPIFAAMSHAANK